MDMIRLITIAFIVAALCGCTRITCVTTYPDGVVERKEYKRCDWRLNESELESSIDAFLKAGAAR